MSRTGVAAGAIAATTVAAGVIQRLFFFSSPLLGDDEGYATLIIQRWADGGALYRDVYSQYGPFHAVAFGLPVRMLDITLTLSRGRTITWALTMLTGVFVATAIWARTRRLVTTVACQLSVGMVLLVGASSMHPGALLCALLGFAVWNFLVVRPRSPRWSDVLTGFVVAAVVLTKLNVGILLLAAVGFVVVTELAPRSPRALQRAASLALVGVGPILFTTQLEGVRRSLTPFLPANRPITLAWWGLTYAVSAICVLAVVPRTPQSKGGRTDATSDPVGSDVPNAAFDLRAAGAGLAAGFVVAVAPVLAGGSSPADIVDGVLIRPSGQLEALTVLPPIDGSTMGWLVASVALVVATARISAHPTSGGSCAVSAALRLTAAATLIWPLVPEMAADGRMFGLLPLAAVGLVPRAGRTDVAARASRLFVVVLALTQSLQVYPVAGPHLAWAAFLLIPVVAFVVTDASDEFGLALSYRLADRPAGVAGMSERAPVAVLPAVGLLVFVSWAFVARSFEVRDVYRSNVPIAQPAERAVRLPASEAQWLAWLDGALQGCEQVVTSPGLNSVHVVLGFPPATGFNATFWEELLSDSEQQSIVDRLRGTSGPVCHVVSDQNSATLRRVWGYGGQNDQPLEIYLSNTKYNVKSEFRGWQVRVLRRG